MNDIITLQHDHSHSPLYSDDLAPVPPERRTWNTWHLAALWIGMAVCIPTYLLASYMLRAGLSWLETIGIIGLANAIITVPMVLNGHAGVKYGIPFPVLGRASFGVRGIHLPAVLRGVVACGWFGIQTWIGGLAIYAIVTTLSGTAPEPDLSAGKFAAFAAFWLLNMYFVWRGTESIKWLEQLSAPVLLLGGLALIYWGAAQTGSFARVLEQSTYLATPTATLTYDHTGATWLEFNGLAAKNGPGFKAREIKIAAQPAVHTGEIGWQALEPRMKVADTRINEAQVVVRALPGEQFVTSSVFTARPATPAARGLADKLWTYLLWLTAMVGFWATMSLSISDITRYAKSQRAQVAGQFIGLPGTMMLFSFVGVFVTCAAMINFDDVLIAEDAPWDPVSLMAKFSNPAVVVLAQLFMIVATLTTNIAANVIAPANAFSNLAPHRISFRTGGLITGIIGVVVCPWLLLDEISALLLFVSGLLGPVLGIMLADYWALRRTRLPLDELYEPRGRFGYGGSGFNRAALIAFAVGVGSALAGYWVPAVGFLYTMSWFTGFLIAFAVYYILMRRIRADFREVPPAPREISADRIDVI